MKRIGWKAVLKLLLGLLLAAYIVWASLSWRAGREAVVCQRVDIVVEDSARALFVSSADVERMLRQKHIYPVGRPMDEISVTGIEARLLTHPFILECECYKSAADVVHVGVRQRLPVLRVMAGGEDYFIDAHGEKVKDTGYAADVVVATGSITPRYAKEYLASLGRLIVDDEFWNSQIEQICVLADGSVELIPRVGNHVVALGRPTECEEKLARLKKFYDKVIARVGWNKYSRISLEYDGQVVCEKR